MDPICVYINWSSYDELSDNVELTEKVALRQLTEYLRLRSKGVRLDYYLMDAFWYDPDGAYRKWRKPHWPLGPGKWLDLCAKHDVKPALWVSSNTLTKLKPAKAWLDSLNRKKSALCMFDGGFLPDFVEVLEYWYTQGVRLFKFDFADLDAATPRVEKLFLLHEIREQNSNALRNALHALKSKYTDIRFIAYNGFGGDIGTTSAPVLKTVDSRWLDVFDSLYCGDPRPADVPAMNFWRSKDIYSDHMVRYYEANGIPLERIDNTSFMVGTTGTCYFRKAAAWQGMLLLSLARGGAVNTYYGNLELIDTAKAEWFSKVQAMYLPLQAMGRTASFGPFPGDNTAPYGFVSYDTSGSLYTVVNQSQSIASVDLATVSSGQAPLHGGKILFCDQGFVPKLKGTTLLLGPEQLCLVGFGTFAQPKYDLGIGEDIVIPKTIGKIDSTFVAHGETSIQSTIRCPKGDIRIVVQQCDGTAAVRSSGGAPPDGKTMGTLLKIRASQDGKELPVDIQYDKAIWSGLSWAVGEIRRSSFKPGKPLDLIFTTEEKKRCELRAEVYTVGY